MRYFSFTIVNGQKATYNIDAPGVSGTLLFQTRKASNAVWTTDATVVMTVIGNSIRVTVPAETATSDFAPCQYRITAGGTPVVQGVLQISSGYTYTGDGNQPGVSLDDVKQIIDEYLKAGSGITLHKDVATGRLVITVGYA